MTTTRHSSWRGKPHDRAQRPRTRRALAGETLARAGDWLVAADLAPDNADPVMAPVYEAAARGALALPFCAALLRAP